MKKIKTILAGILAGLITLLFVSCPEPLTEDVVTAALDKLPPVIEIYSPGENELYYADVVFSLNVHDDATSEGDNKGDIASISFDVSNDDLRGGKIDISPGGKVTADTDFGPDLIDYDMETGDLTFSFSTVEPSILDGLLSVTIIATDRNGNETEEKISLYENDGPWFDFQVLDAGGSRNVYLANESVYLSGKVANSADDLLSSSDIYRIEWNIAGILSAQLILDDNETYQDPYTNATMNYYNSSTGLYESRIAGYLLELNTSYFTFNPADGSFSASIYMKYQLQALGTINMTMEVEDLSGHVTTDNVLLTPDYDVPDIAGTVVLSDGSAAHFSSNGTADKVYGTSGDPIASFASFEYQLKSGNAETTTTANGITITDASYNADPSGSYFKIDFGSKISELVNHASYVSGNPVNLLITAISDNDLETQIPLVVVEDSTAPVIESFSLASNALNSDYATSSSTLNMSFTVNEDRDLINANELKMTGHLGNSSLNNSTLSEGPQNFSSIGTSWSNGQTGDQNVEVLITLSDRLGNTRTYVQDNAGVGETNLGSTVMYYPAATWSAVITPDMSAGGDEWAKANETVTLTLTPTRDMQSINNVTIDGLTTVAGAGYSFTATQTETGVSSRSMTVNFDAVDKAGNDLGGSITNAAQLVTYDSVAPDLTSLGFVLSGKGTYGAMYLNKDILAVDRAAVMTLQNLNSASLNDNYKNYTYHLNSDSESGSLTDAQISLNSLNTAAEGSQTVYVTVYDEAGNSSTKNFGLILDITPPDLSSSVFAMTGEGVYNSTFLNRGILGTGDNEALSITGMGSDFATATYEFNSEGANALSVSGEEATIPLVNFSAKTDGEYLTTVTAMDEAGNTGEASFTFILDKVLPPDYGITLEGDGTFGTYYLNSNLSTSSNNEKISLTGLGSTVEDFKSYNYSLDNQSGSFSSTSDKIDVDWMATGRADGNYTLALNVYDQAGNVLSKNYSITLDQTLPDLSSLDYTTSGTGWHFYVAGDKMFINKGIVGSTDADLTLTGLPTGSANFTYFNYSVTHSSDSSDTVSGSNVTSPILDFTFLDNTDFNEGLYNLNVTVYDQAGNTASSSFPIYKDTAIGELDNISIALAGHGVANTVYLNSDILTTPDNEEIQMTSVSVASDETMEYLFKKSTDSDPSRTAITGNENVAVDQLDEAAYTDGDYQLKLFLEDNAGNTDTRTYTITLDKTVPDLSTLTFTMSGAGTYANGGYFYLNSGLDDLPSDDYLNFDNIDAIVPDLAEFTYNLSSDGVAAATETDTSINISLEAWNEDADGDFTLTVSATDDAGNTSDDKVFNFTKDTVAPVLTGLALDLNGDGVTGTSPVYINENGDSSATKIDLLVQDGLDGLSDGDSDPDALSTVSDRFSYYRYSFNGFSSYSGDLTSDSILFSAFSSLGDGSKTMEVRVYDAAHNYASASLDFTIDRIKPTAISSISGIGTKTLTINFAAAHNYSGSGFTLTNQPADTEIDSTDPNKIIYTSVLSNFVTQTYTIPNTILTDDAGNKNYTFYNLTTTEAVALSGISNSHITINPSRIPSRTGSSYKSARTYSFTAPDQSSAGIRDLSDVSSGQSESGILEKNASYTSAVTAAAFNPPASPVMSRSMREKIDLDTSDKSLTRAMEQVDFNSREYREQLEGLLAPELTRAELRDMNDLLIPAIVEPEILTVSTSPVMTGVSGQVDIILADDAVVSEKPLSYLALQVLGWLLAAMVTTGFILLMKKMSKS